MKKSALVLLLLTLFTFIFAQESEATSENDTSIAASAEDSSSLFMQQDVPAAAVEALAKMDENTFFEADISTLVTIEQTDPEKGTSISAFRFFRRDADDKFLLLTEKPESQLGTGYLKIDEGVWTYDPESRQFSFQSENERIGNTDTDSSDYSSFKFSNEYDIRSAEETKLGNFDVWLLALAAKNEEVSPPFMRLWISKDPNVLLKEEEYSLTQRLTYTNYYPKYATIDGRFIPEQQVGVDNLVEGRTFRLQLEDISLAAIPDNIFTKAYVERVNR